MPQPGLIFRVLIASPADCSDEREILRKVVLKWNTDHSLQEAILIEPVLWETHAIPEHGDRPQAILNKQLVQHCDILIAIFSSRLGTNTGVAESGTAEEIREFLRDKKTALVYFSIAPIERDQLDNEQLQTLAQFKNEIRSQGIAFDFRTHLELENLVSSHLGKHIRQLSDIYYEEMDSSEAPNIAFPVARSHPKTLFKQMSAHAMCTRALKFVSERS